MRQVRDFLCEYVRKNMLSYLALLLLFSLGILVGAMAVHVLPEAEKTGLGEYMDVFFSDIERLSKLGSGAMFLDVWWLHAKTLLIVWILGFTIIGVPFILCILFMRGFVIGFTVGFLVQNFFLKGFAASVTAVLPHNLLMVPIYLSVCCAAISFSLYLIKKRNAASQKLLSAAANYTFLCVLLNAGAAVSAVLEVFISPVLTRWVFLLF